MDIDRSGLRLVVAGLLLASVLVASGPVLADTYTASTPSSNGTLVGVQGAETANGSVVLYDRHGDISFRVGDATSYHSVERLPNGNILASYLAEGYKDCGEYAEPCARTGFRIFDTETGEIVREWSFPVRSAENSEVHDTEPLPSGEMLVADMDRERILTVAENGSITWQWNASQFYEDNPKAAEEDWLHINDVDRIADGQFLVSVRNANQLLIVERGEGVVDVINRNRSTDVLYHQHNPQMLNASRVLVADSENDRIVELQKKNGTWVVVWELEGAGGQAFNWPRDADRLPNGNTIITDSRNNRIVEINQSGSVVWSRHVPNLPYEADRLPGSEKAGGMAYTSPPESADTGGSQLGLSSLNSAMGLLRHVVEIPYWVSWWHLVGWMMSTVLVGVGSVRHHRANRYDRSDVASGWRTIYGRARTMSTSEKYWVSMGFAGATLIITSPIAWNFFDVHLFMLTWSESLSQGWNVYEYSNSQYPPLATYLFIGFELLGRATTDNILVNSTSLDPINWVRMITRIPLMAGFIATAHLLYRRWGWSTARYWILAPPALAAFVLTSVHHGFTFIALLSWTSVLPLYTFWGYQFDLIAVPLTLLATFALLDRKPYRFATYATLGAMIKLYPVLLLPLALARFDLRDTTKGAIVSIAIASSVLLPFYIGAPHEMSYQLFGFQSWRFPQGLSIFHIPLLLVEYDTRAFAQFTALKWLWQVVWLPIYGYLVYLGWQTQDDESLILVVGAILTSFVLFNKIGNVNYLLWFWPFLLFALDRGYISWRYPTGIIATATMYIITIQFSATVVGKRIFIIQELEWYRARELAVNSFEGIAQPSFIARIAELNAEYGVFFDFIYSNRFVLLPLIILVHAIAMVGVLYRFTAQAETHGGVPSLSDFSTTGIREGRQEQEVEQ